MSKSDHPNEAEIYESGIAAVKAPTVLGELKTSEGIWCLDCGNYEDQCDCTKAEAQRWLRAFCKEVERRAELVDVKRRASRITIAFDELKRELLGD